MLTMTIGAYGGVPNAFLYGLPVNTRFIRFCDFAVASPTGFHDFPVIDFRTRIPAGEYCVTSMTVRASCRILPGLDGAAVHALKIGFDRPRQRNLVAREKLGIAVTSRAGVGKPLSGYQRSRVGGRQDRMHGTVATGAVGRVTIAHLQCLPVNTLRKTLYLTGVAFGALPGRNAGRGNIVRTAMA